MTDQTITIETDDTTPDEVAAERAADEVTATHTDDDQDDPETFPRAYVEKLRQEAADARVRARDRDSLAERLHTALVAATGRLADPTDLAFSEDHLTDPDALTAAVDELLARKPHLASRRPTGSIAQGATAPASAVDLAGILRRAAQ
ncbi:hypothetical protein [Arsenicicoccus dermatophilus]|uniref:hypothetical protein n=1 Tax=Arsenicicoccus dermatophilus TaxID=1076331 RepID=UPI001F4D1298|nr:hypothetical protein [Arsenicicoccus dermatophilus]MCH8612328.1 hypothetical protein [Arsenicicoccus dermatophilus]